MIALTHMEARRVAVFGLGGSGLVTAHALAAGGAEIVCYDDKRERVDAAWDAGLPTGDLRVADFTAFDALVLSPGVPLTHPEPHWTVKRAKDAGVEIIGDIELFDRERRVRMPRTRLVAVTGTNGKSTVTALLTHLLAEMGAEVQMGGNIGRPALDLDPREGIVVLEVSSYQIDLSPTLKPDVGVLLNITPDHIDRHGSMANYTAVKRRLVEASGTAVIGPGAFEIAKDFIREGRIPTRWFGADDWLPDGPDYEALAHDLGGAVEGVIFCDLAERREVPGRAHPTHVPVRRAFFAFDGTSGRPIGEVTDFAALKGSHNGYNAAAALAVVGALGLDPAAAVPHLATFPGLPHRLEEVGRKGETLFINDSKATNAFAAGRAILSFPRIHWIAGGVAKAGGIAELEHYFGPVARAYLIGEAAQDFARTLSARGVDFRQCGTLDVAFAQAAAAAEREGGVVLLSPACASFDQFRSFEERGDTFRALVRAHLSQGAA